MKKISLTLFFVLFHFCVFSQTRYFRTNLKGIASITSDDQVPFWMRSIQYGSIPLTGPSVSLIGSIHKDYDTTKARFADWGAGIEGRLNAGKGSEAILVEGYAKAKLGVIELKGGRMKEFFGLTDTLLTTGNYAMSGNALGIPKIQIAIPEFYPIPIFGEIFAIKGLYAQGWLGDKGIQFKRIDHAVTYFHQKAFYVRIGKPEWRLKLYGGFNDQAFWGHEAEIFESFILTGWEKYWSVVFGKNWAQSKVGNHAGNIDFRIDYDFDNIRVGVYRQNFYEVGGLYHLANIADGINGLTLQNKAPHVNNFYWKRFVFEFLYSKNQAGEAWSKPTTTGNENYLNHDLYTEGWSYKGLGLGTPFITQAGNAAPGQYSIDRNFFINNRVAAVHLGMDLSFGRWSSLAKFSFSKNFGTHDTRLFKEVDQFSAYLDNRRKLKNNWEVGGTLAFDYGKLLNNSTGLMFVVSKSFN
ncbi:capsule assembly Wzi family protein [Dyadobacter pollutisoli]|uniref:Capsule assembly Wzi family protein n=1 Tax=Dyadobacter pollutisoli TaxID=2910158 RepID=A0A9E8SLM3_9BACT|nr:capsule assembly Wzi family protein [Dyadobacter pollutisoli]WAC13233.1 capsule assembly Wzi family protein [Dyadobacter pollutisoli]